MASQGHLVPLVALCRPRGGTLDRQCDRQSPQPPSQDLPWAVLMQIHRVMLGLSCFLTLICGSSSRYLATHRGFHAGVAWILGDISAGRRRSHFFNLVRPWRLPPGGGKILGGMLVWGQHVRMGGVSMASHPERWRLKRPQKANICVSHRV